MCFSNAVKCACGFNAHGHIRHWRHRIPRSRNDRRVAESRTRRASAHRPTSLDRLFLAKLRVATTASLKREMAPRGAVIGEFGGGGGSVA